MPTSPNNFKNIKIIERQNNKNNIQVMIIGVWFNRITKPLKSNEKILIMPVKKSKFNLLFYFGNNKFF